MAENHARTSYVIVDSDDGRETFRPAGLDLDIELFGKFSNLVDLSKTLKEKRRRDGGPVAATDRYPVLAPIFGSSGSKATEDVLAALRRLAATMYGSGENGRIPSGYTYLSQFVAHEMCRSVPLEQEPGEAENQASFALDLDSVYRTVPCDGLRLLLGLTNRNDAPFDIKRGQDGSPELGNSRNDANLALSQIHCAVVRFHNTVAEAEIFSDFNDIKRQVVLCFQKVLIDDLLPTLASRQLLADILGGRRFTQPGQVALCPAESVLAAFRFGHSMVRREYEKWNDFTSSAASIAGLLRFTGAGGGLDQGRLPWEWPIDWRSMFDFGAESAGRLTHARRIDTIIEEQFQNLDARLFDIRKDERSLAYRTLWFGAVAGIKDGWAIQDMLAKCLGDGEFAMRPERIAEGRPDLEALFAELPILSKHPPLWWFILREAELFGVDGGLSGVGARIVAETVVAAIEASDPSVLSGEQIHRELPGAAPGTATMAGLLSWGGQPLDWFTTAYNFGN